MTMTCEKSWKYRPYIQNFKRDDTGSRKCDLHNHDLCENLFGHPIVCRLMPEEKECVLDMTLNLVQSKNMLASLKRKRRKNILNIKEVYNIWYQYNKTLRGI